MYAGYDTVHTRWIGASNPLYARIRRTYRVVAWKRCAAVVPLQREMKYCAGTAESSSTSCSTATPDSWGITAQPSPGDGNTRQVDAAGATPKKKVLSQSKVDVSAMSVRESEVYSDTAGSVDTVPSGHVDLLTRMF